jgi:hypothetical protein
MKLPNEIVSPQDQGKLTVRDQRVSQLLTLARWLPFLIVGVPVPIVFLALFLFSATTESAALYLLHSFVSLWVGLVVGLALFILLSFYRRRWHSRLRDRLATDGITAAEVPWFQSELSSEERKTWRELKQHNPLLADAYCETLAARLTATRIGARARGEVLRIERQINRTRNLHAVDTTSLLNDLMSDRERVGKLRGEAAVRLSEAKARLQTIEAAANRSLSQIETEAMLRRLAASQEQLPLALEIANLEQQAMRDFEGRSSDDIVNSSTQPSADR